MDALGLTGRSDQGFRETVLVTEPFRSDSQAENAGSIPVTRSTSNPQLNASFGRRVSGSSRRSRSSCHIEIGEVTRLRPVEQGDQLSPSELLEVERRTRNRDHGRMTGRHIDGDVDDDKARTTNREPSEGRTQLNSVDGPPRP
jgi:hypothetical protein